MGGDDDKIKEVLDQCYDLSLEVAADRFKSYDELKKKFLWVMGQEAPKAGSKPKPAPQNDADELDELAKMAQEEKPKAEKPKAEKPAKAETKVPPMPTATDEDDDDAYFAKLLED
jgi:hypothetical protein